MVTNRPATVVHKFGGTSLADSACFRRVAKIVAERPEERRLVVVSAMAGVTDQLVRAVHVAGKRDLGYRDIVAEVMMIRIVSNLLMYAGENCRPR